MFDKFIECIINIMYPKKCVICNEIIEYKNSKDYVCLKCRENIPFISGNICKKCGKPIDYGEICSRCMETAFAFDFGFSPFEYEIVRKSIFRLKYKGVKKDGKAMGELMSLFVREKYNDVIKNIDIIVPVPIHEKKLKKREFNQADIIGKRIAQNFNIVYKDDLIKRIRNTVPQNSLEHKERKENIKDAFVITDKEFIKDKSIMIVDDIFTTGSTINECSRLLIMNGAKNVVFYTFSIT